MSRPSVSSLNRDKKRLVRLGPLFAILRPCGHSGRGIFGMTLTQNGTDVAGAVQLTGLGWTEPARPHRCVEGR
jgi:hypothetical protein